MRLVYKILVDCLTPILAVAETVYEWVLTKADPEQGAIWIYVVPGDEAAEELRSQLEVARQDPEFSVVTNYEIARVALPRGATLIAEEAPEAGIIWLRQEIEKALDDPNYDVICPFNIEVFERKDFFQ